MCGLDEFEDSVKVIKGLGLNCTSDTHAITTLTQHLRNARVAKAKVLVSLFPLWA